jgi:hypothetical protein
MTGKLRDLTVNRDGSQNVTVTVNSDFSEAFDRLKDKPVSVEIKKASNGRSKDANAFCWALCSEIGKAMTPPVSKDEIYRGAIKAVGVYMEVPLLAWDIPVVRGRWEGHGTGWFIEIADDAGIGKKLVHMYFGSSTYTVDEMRVLLDWLVDQAQQMEIPIPLSKAQEEELLERWGKK